MKTFLAFIGVLLSFSLRSQFSNCNNALKLQLAAEHHSSAPLSLLVKANIAKLKAYQTIHHYQLHYSSGDIASITCDPSALAALIEKGVVSYAELIEPRKRLMNDTMIYRNRIKPVKVWTANLPRAYDGEGVVLGFIDSGVDFNHPDLKDSLGKTRVKFLWDQNLVPGPLTPPPPTPYFYGVEWTAAQIDANLCSHTDLVHYGHGTHVAGIAAANGLGNGSNEGCAPKSDIVFVALDFSRPGPTISDAVDYILAKAAQLGKPCVINASVGDYYGSHDGTNLEAQLIDNLVANKPGIVMVASAGNAGNYRHHVKTQVQGSDTLFSWLSNPYNVYDYWCYGDTNQLKNLEIGVGANRSNYSDLGSIGFKPYGYGLTGVRSDTLYHQGHRIGIVETSASINTSGVYELYLRIAADSSNLLWRIDTRGIGTHHAWNFDFVSSGLPSSNQFPRISRYLTADTLYSLANSFQCSDEVITVGNYNNLSQYYDMRDTLHHVAIGGEISYDSSLGPTRDGRIKPDVAATGDYIFSCMPLGLKSALMANHPEQVAKGLLHMIGGGTSAASPVVAGLCALYLQRFPNATNQQVKTAIRLCAYHDGFTGSSLPDNQWGFGKLDGKATMTCGENFFVNVGENFNATNAVCFPNPFQDQLTINVDAKYHNQVNIYDVLGNLVFQKKDVQMALTLNARDLPPGVSGVLFLHLSNAQGLSVCKLIKE